MFEGWTLDLTGEELNHLNKIIAYLRDTEESHFEECEEAEQENHIFRSVLAIEYAMKHSFLPRR